VDIPAAPGGTPTIAGAHNVCPGDNLPLTVNANGFPTPTYQWQVNGAPAAGATSGTFNAPTATGTGARAVTVVINSANSVGTSAAYSTTPHHTYHLTAEPQGLNGRTASYVWMMNGQPIAGATSSTVDLPDSGAGAVTVRITVQNPPVTSAPASFTIQPLTPPPLTFAVNPGTVPYTSGPITLAAQATASQCGGAVTVRYSGEGVTGNTFTPGSVSGFDMGNRIRPQTRTVTITATATDAKNQTVTRTAPVTVTLTPEARRLDDIVFPNMSSRVNNCGKRLLLEELTPILRNDPGAKVYLIGHRDEKEKGSKAALALDATRALNAAAVLSAGKGICPSLDLSRIMYKAVGADQSDTPRPALCGASAKVTEKAGQGIRESDKNAEFRRAEIWVIPSGAAEPAGVTGMMALQADRMTKIGCPK
jgi:outer membrane protein OmpA-like peptidoglycan-associated protein